MTHDTTFQNARRTAALLGVPVTWLKREADAGRVPCLRAGRRRMFDPDAVRRVLADRASADMTISSVEGVDRA